MNEGVTLQYLIALYSDKLWPKGSHRESALLYLTEISGLLKMKFVSFDADLYTELTEALLLNGNKASTVNRKIFALTKLLRRAQADNLIPNVPIYKRLQENEADLRYITIYEEDELLSRLEEFNLDYKLLSSFLIDTGVTVGEAIAVKWENIEFRKVHILESTKGLARTLPLTQRCHTLTNNLRRLFDGPFSHINQNKFRLVWNAVKTDMGLESDDAFVPTVLRHTCASRLILSGLNLTLVQKWLGNRNYKSMSRYEVLCNNENFDPCVDALERFIDP